MHDTVDVTIQLDRQTKKHLDEICSRAGLSLETLLTAFCRKVAHNQCTPADITFERELFYSDASVRYVRARLDALSSGILTLDISQEPNALYSNSSIRYVIERIRALNSGNLVLEEHTLVRIN